MSAKIKIVVMSSWIAVVLSGCADRDVNWGAFSESMYRISDSLKPLSESGRQKKPELIKSKCWVSRVGDMYYTECSPQ